MVVKQKNNFIFEPLEWVDLKTITHEHNKVKRSLIHPQYANKFLRTYVLDKEINNEKIERNTQKI